MVKNIKFDVKTLAKELKVNEIIAKLLVNRGIFEKDLAYKFINPTVEELEDPRKMKDLVTGLEIIKDYIEKELKILVVGDYDVSSLN